MIRFFKAQASSFIATAVDFAVTVLLKEVLKFWYLLASFIGTFSGGVVNFLLGRKWVFESTQGRAHIQFGKYLLVWIGNLILNAGGVFALTNYIGSSYIVSKIITSVLVGIFYNYLLHKRYVFKEG